MSKILIIEDDPAILEAMGMMLEVQGYEVDMLQQGSKSIEKIKSYRPQLIILDMLMSGIDGRDICALIKGDQETKDIKVVMISAYPDAEQSVFNYGADDFLAKPFEVEDLYAMAKKYT